MARRNEIIINNYARPRGEPINEARPWDSISYEERRKLSIQMSDTFMGVLGYERILKENTA